MEHRSERENLERHLTILWSRMTKARDRGDWQSYWMLRRSWLSLGRTLSILIQLDAEERRAQLSLFDGRVGRAHDKQAG